MTNQEILFRLFICEYFEWQYDEEHFSHYLQKSDSTLSKVVPLFPRENEPISLEGYLDEYINLKSGEMRNNNIIRFHNKVKITILED